MGKRRPAREYKLTFAHVRILDEIDTLTPYLRSVYYEREFLTGGRIFRGQVRVLLRRGLLEWNDAEIGPVVTDAGRWFVWGYTLGHRMADEANGGAA